MRARLRSGQLKRHKIVGIRRRQNIEGAERFGLALCIWFGCGLAAPHTHDGGGPPADGWQQRSLRASIRAALLGSRRVSHDMPRPAARSPVAEYRRLSDAFPAPSKRPSSSLSPWWSGWRNDTRVRLEGDKSGACHVESWLTTSGAVARIGIDDGSFPRASGWSMDAKRMVVQRRD